MKKLGMAALIGAWVFLCSGLSLADTPDQESPDGAIGQGQESTDGSMSFDTYVELLRTDLRAQKKQIVSKSMGLTPEQEKVFWPIYNDYEHDMARLTDKGVALVKDYSKNFKSMTDETARDLMSRTLKNQGDKLSLRKAYARKFEKALSARIAARFLQVDGIVTRMIELQIDSKLPLIR